MSRIHILGASGSGTTTLAEALAEQLGCAHFDTDAYFWTPSNPPFQNARPVDERQALLKADLESKASWILSGSSCGWGDFAIPMFDLVVFLWIPPEIRMERLRRREIERYGPDIEDPNHPMHHTNKEFIAWAAAYDSGGLDMRSRARHEEWLAALECPALRIERTATIQENAELVLSAL